MPQTEHKYGLIFDFDGLMMDTEFPIYDAWSEIYRQHGQDLAVEEWGVCVGNGEFRFDPVADLEKKTGKELDSDKLREEHLELFRQKLEVKPMPGVADLIEDCLREKWAISVASSSPYSWVHENLTKIGLRDYFSVIRSSDDVEKTKPDPALFNLAMEAMGTSPANTFVVEDSPHGIEAAKIGGTFAVAVPNRVTVHLNLDKADLRLNSLAEISLQKLLKIRYPDLSKISS